MMSTTNAASTPVVSVILRTYNESRHLDELLTSLRSQDQDTFSLEVVLVDSGSTDGTLEIAARHAVKIVHIKKSDFTYGRSLNLGCAAAAGDIFTLISGHCIPTNSAWLKSLVKPLLDGIASCTYGRQLARDTTKFSERQLFSKYFPNYSKIVQDGFFCNNANAAITREVWCRFGYNEQLTGLEDMHLARQICESGGRIAYISEAAVFHIHDESWRQVRVRYEREALALQQILPNVHFGLRDFIIYWVLAVIGDAKIAFSEKCILRETRSIILFRLMQYWGTYKGSRKHRIISAAMKHSYFYPKDLERGKYVNDEGGSVTANESEQRAS